MKKKILFSGLFPLLVLGILFSCQKKDNLPKNETGKHVPIDGSNGDQTLNFRTDPDSCDYYLGLITTSNGRLVFEDDEHFQHTCNCLEMKYEAHNDAFESEYPNATAEQLDSLAALDNFNEWETYEQFESNLKFSSLRAKVKADSETFLASKSADSIDLSQDPDELCLAFRTAERALLNEDFEVVIDTELLDENDWGARGEGDCAWLKVVTHLFDVNDTPVLVDRQVKMHIAIQSGFVNSKLYGKIKYYKKDPVTGKYKSNVRADMKIGVTGIAYDINCDRTIQWWSKYNGFKKRTSLDVCDGNWLNFRTCFVDGEDPTWNTVRCIAHGYLFNASNYFPVGLKD